MVGVRLALREHSEQLASNSLCGAGSSHFRTCQRRIPFPNSAETDSGLTGVSMSEKRRTRGASLASERSPVKAVR